MGFHYNNGSSWSQILSLKSGSSEFSNTVTSSVDFRAPYFRSLSNPTSKYIYPDGESQLTQLSIDGGTGDGSNDATLFVSATDNSDWGIKVDKYRGSATDYGIRVDVQYSSGTTALQVLGNDVQRFRVAGDGAIYGAHFYDNANTSYYSDPASTSILNAVRMGGQVSVNTTSVLSSAGQLGIYASSSPYISFHNGTTSRTAYFQEAGSRFYMGEVSYTETEGSFRAPLFYDVSNTNYYCDPASWSTLYDVNIIRNLSLNGSNGTAGQVLQTNGPNNSPTWVDAGGGAWEVIGNYTGTNVNSVDFINNVNGFVWNNSTYKRIKLYGNLVGYSGRTVMVHFLPLVSNGSSGNVVPTNLVYYVTEFTEGYPEYSVTLTSSFQYVFQSNSPNNNGIMFQAQCGSLPTAGQAGIGMFSNSIGGTTYYSNKRKLDTTVTAEFDSIGLGTDRTFSWRAWVSHDYPSFYFYPRRISGETLSYGWTNQGIRVAGSNSSSNFNYDFTFLGLKP